jgi:hypothetical protein
VLMAGVLISIAIGAAVLYQADKAARRKKAPRRRRRA